MNNQNMKGKVLFLFSPIIFISGSFEGKNGEIWAQVLNENWELVA